MAGNERGEGEIAWEAPEFLYREKSVSWYWITIIAATILIGIAAWQGNLLFGLFVVVAELLVIAWGHKEPTTMHFRLAGEGVSVNGNAFIPYAELESFSAEEWEGETWARLALSSRRRMKPPLKILVPQELMKDVKTALQRAVAEVPHEPSLLDTIEELVGF